MSYEHSPAVERARVAAEASAQRAGVAAVRLCDWILSLIEDDEGKPATLLQRIGVELASFRAKLDLIDCSHPPAPSTASLFSLGREKSITLRGDPTLTTEFVLLAVLESDPAFREYLESLGVQLIAIESLLRVSQYENNLVTDTTELLTIAEPRELIEAARITDANLNRAREALRVIEDYCRFVLNDRILSEEVKSLRHDLAEVTNLLPAGPLLAARDTRGDVGTEITSSGEYERHSTIHVTRVNLKRLQESLRSIEEFGKVFGTEIGKRTESIRYRAYTLERALVLGNDARARLIDSKLYVLLTGSQCVASLDWTIAEAAAGGAQIFQMREKELTDQELLERARRFRHWTREAGVLFIVNDRPDIALISGADGVHLGQDDLPVSAARKLLGSEALIGVSTHSIEQVRKAILDGADYIGVGPTFTSQTKSFEHFPGLDFIRQVSQETSLPAFALGGIDLKTVQLAVKAGASRVAVSSVIARDDDPQSIAKALRQALIS